MTDDTLVIRTDANARIGTGHLMRCLALAQAWQDRGGRVIFITSCDSDGLLHRLQDEGFEIAQLEKTYPDADDWETTTQVLADYPDAWVVLDGYQFDSNYQLRIKRAGHPLLVIDDTAHLDHYYTDILLNQNIRADQLKYTCEPGTQLLLGTEYVLLRREFWPWRDWKRKIPDVARKVLVTLGGGDPDNQALKVIRALQQVDVDGLEAAVVVGASNQHYQELESAVHNSKQDIRLVRNVTSMPDLMAWADVAVTAAGSTCWEAAFMGLPSLLLMLADNQRKIAEGLNKVDGALNLGWHTLVTDTNLARAVRRLIDDVQQQQEMSNRGQQLVDGDGVVRVLMYLRGEKIWLRPVREEDCSLLWKWANDPDVRAVSFSERLIPWEEHVGWLHSKLSDPNCTFYIAMNREGEPIGQVRYDISGREAVISISIEQRFRGKGYGSSTIRLASQDLLSDWHVQRIHAYVRQGNEASVDAFAKAGFREIGITTVHEQQAIQLSLWRDEQ